MAGGGEGDPPTARILRWASRGGPFRLYRFPGGESLAEHRVRVAAALVTVRAGPLPALVVCHGGTIRAVGGLAGPRGEVRNCMLHRLPVPAASTR